VRDKAVEEEILPPPLPPPPPLSRAVFAYGDLDTALAEMEATIRRTRAALDRFCANKSD